MTVRTELREAIYRGELPFSSRRINWRGGQYDVGAWRWRAAQCQDLPGVIVRELLKRADRFDDEAEDYAGGTRYVAEHVAELRAANIHNAYDELEIRRSSERCARISRTFKTLPEREQFAREQGLEPPVPSRRARDCGPQMKRLGCERWWRRSFRRCWTRRSEEAQRALGLISRRRAGYCSDGAVGYRKMQLGQTAQFMIRHQLENECGEQLELLALAAHSLANPAIRRGELMVRIRGFEEIAHDIGHVALFFTLTCPSAFHRMLATGAENPRWEKGLGVRAGQLWLRQQWARARATLARLNIRAYGVRVAEPHHDGTPHWHVLLFVRKDRAPDLERVIRAHWLAEYGTEPGAERHRVKVERISAAKGSAVGYVSKYIAKNIDAHGQMADDHCDETDLPAVAAAERVRAWAAVHGIRQFQQIGGPPVGLWRECRRLRDGSEDPGIGPVVAAADAGDWRGFCYALGPFFQREKLVSLEKQLFGDLNSYGELAPERIVGIRCASAFEPTRPHLWRLKSCTPQLSVGPSGLSASSSALSLLSAAYSSVLPSSSATRAEKWTSTTTRSSTAQPGRRTDRSNARSATCAQAVSSAVASAATGWRKGVTAGTEDLSSSFLAARSRRLGPVAITVRAAAPRQKLERMADHNSPIPAWMLALIDPGG